jgi:hypothetical protein
MDRAPLVDFCNQLDPRARPHDRPIPAPDASRGQRALARAARPVLRRRLGREGAEALSYRRRRGSVSCAAEATPDAVPAPSTGSAVAAPPSEAEAPHGCTGSYQPRFTGQGPDDAEAYPTCAIARRTPSLGRAEAVGGAGDGALSRSPLRAPGSGRYPNPIRSDTSRRETAWPPGGDSGGPHPRLGMPGRRRHAPVRERCLHDLTSRAPTPAKGRSSRARDDPLARGRRQCLPRRVSRRAWSAAARDVSLARTHREPRAASPALPRRRARFAEPEVPSIGEPATPASTRPTPRVSEATAPSTGSPDGGVRPGTGGSPQAVANLWKMVDAFCNLNGSAALDGASGERSSGDVAEG